MISINISELIWTVINFFLLYFLLNRFLYRPLISFMEQRQAGIDAKVQEKLEAQERVRENDERLAEEKAKSRDEAKRILNQAESELEQRRSEALLKAQETSAQERKDAEAALEQRRQQTAEKLQGATSELAEVLTQRLLAED